MTVVEPVRPLRHRGVGELLPRFQRRRNGPGIEVGSFEAGDLRDPSRRHTVDDGDPHSKRPLSRQAGADAPC